MLKYGLCVLAGGWSLTVFERLPGAALSIGIALACAALAVPRASRPLAAALAGLLLMCIVSRAELGGRLSPALSGNSLIFDAEIIDFSSKRNESLRLLVAPDAAAGLPTRMRLSWYGAERMPRLGERWRFSARLRRPRGFANPGGFDYAGWLFRQGIGATGYVLRGDYREDAASQIARFRRGIVERVNTLLPDDDASAVLLAIAVGARHRITRAAWDRYANTGTTHLMAISGLHVGLLAGAAFLLGRALFALLLPHANARDGAIVIALIAAAIYVAISGLAVPARRALLMAALAATALLCRRRLSMPHVLGVCGLAVFVSDPLALLAPGFTLSFAAVAILLWAGARRRARRGSAPGILYGARDLTHLQSALLFGLFPLTAVIFSRASWIAPLANFLVLPLFSLVTVPAALFGAAAGGPAAVLGDSALWLAWGSLKGLLWILDGLNALPGAAWPLAERTGFASVTLLLAALWALLPPGWPGRHLAWPALLASFLYRPPAPPAGCLDLHVLDVGQGLAAVVRTADHLLVFDTGPAWRSGGDTAQLAVLPFLQSIGEPRIDVAVISHADQDHAGGLRSLIAGAEVRLVLAGEPYGSLPVPEQACRSGTRWHWDGVDFRMLHPPPGAARSGNNASCVLEVAAGAHRVLLTGDIERPVEYMLVERGLLSRSAIVLVPHHGSRTSSSAAMVTALQAEYALVAAGFDNRWGFPKPDIVARWEASGAAVATTANAGALQFRVCSDGGITRAVRWREVSRRFWHDR